MNQNCENNFYVENKIKSKSYMFFIPACLISVVDVFLMFVAILTGIANAYIISIIALSIVDVLITIAISQSNFRFEYSKKLPIIQFIVALITSIIILVNGKSSLSIVAGLLYIGVHLTYYPLFISLIKAVNREGIKSKIYAFILAIIFVGISITYIGFVAKNGYYGQGGLSYRGLQYEYDSSTDSYSIVGIEEGNSTNILIPEKHNGKTVKRFNLSLLGQENITEVKIESINDITFKITDYKGLAFNGKIIVDKNDIKVANTKLASVVESNRNTYAISIYNSVIPCNLTSEETYITFSYTLDSMRKANYKPIHAWVGKKNTVFKLKNHEPLLTYTKNYDVTNEEFLYENYLSNGSLVCIDYNGQTIENKPVTNPIEKVEVSFQNVYRLKIAPSNDSIYDSNNAASETAYRSFNNTGYRFVLQNTNILENKEGRAGFTLKWEYSTGASSTKQTLVSLSDVLYRYNIVTVYPVWTMNKPSVSLSFKKANVANASTIFTYGDDVEINCTETKDSASFVYSYYWSTPLGTNTKKSFTVNKIKPADSGNYQVSVTCSSPSSSLVSSKDFSEIITINKKELSMQWSLDGIANKKSITYDGNSHTVECSVASATISGDTINYTLGTSSYKLAGSYLTKATLISDTAENYYIQSGNDSHSLVINKKNITGANIILENTDLIYNGSYQTKEVLGVEIDSLSATYYVSGNEQKNASNNYSLTITGNGNFTGVISKNWSISKKDVTITWGSTTFEYDSYTHYPTVVNASGVVNGENFISSIKYTAASKQVNAGNNYTCNIDSYDSNYNISNQTSCNYIISRKSISDISDSDVVFSNQLVYNTLTQIQLIKSVKVGNLYATYSVTDNTGKDAGYYYLTVNGTGNFDGEKTVLFAISKRDISSNFNIKLGANLTYNGQAQTKQVENLKIDNVSIAYNVSGNIKTNAGNYVMTIEPTDTLNYSGSISQNYTIDKKSIATGNAVLTEHNYVYDGTSHTQNVESVTVDSLSATYTVKNNKGTNAGTYNFTIEGNGNFTGTIKKSFTISPKSIANAVVSLVANNFVYDGSNHTQTISSITVDGLTVNDYSLSNNTKKDAGTYTITITGNKNFTGSTTKNFTISKRSIDGATVSLGTNLTYNGNLQTQSVNSVVIDGVVVDDYTILNNEQTNSGTYSLTIQGNNNFTGSTTKSFTISKKQVNISWGNNSFIYDGQSKEYKPTINGLLSGADFEYQYYSGSSLLQSAPKNVGTYKTKVVISNSNYEIIGLTEKTFTITQANIED